MRRSHCVVCGGPVWWTRGTERLFLPSGLVAHEVCIRNAAADAPNMRRPPRKDASRAQGGPAPSHDSETNWDAPITAVRAPPSSSDTPAEA